MGTDEIFNEAEAAAIAQAVRIAIRAHAVDRGEAVRIATEAAEDETRKMTEETAARAFGSKG